jgi:muramidase (phage lysozyme)
VNKKAIVIGLVLLAAAGAALAYSRRGGADLAPTDTPPDPVPTDPVYDPGAADWIGYWSDQNAQEIQGNTMPTPDQPSPDANVRAMGDTVSKSEGTFSAGNPYAVCFGYKHTINDFSDHPAVTGEWRGEPLSAKLCAGAGLGPGCVSTAAGKYQIIKPTWLKLKAALSLPDFGPESQEKAFTELLRQRGALEAVKAGRFADAVFAARREWASLKGAGYGQGEHSLEWLTAKFTESGGVLA